MKKQMKYSKEIEKLIDAAVLDGKLQKAEVKALRTKAELEGLNPDEVESYAQEKLMLKNYTNTKHSPIKSLFEWLAPFVGLAAMLGAIILISEYFGGTFDSDKHDVCNTRVARCISHNKLEKAEYYVKSYSKRTSDISSSIASLEQAYIDNGNVDKAVNLCKWATSNGAYNSVLSPLYEYYMAIEEFDIAEEFLSKRNSTKVNDNAFMEKYYTYYQHLTRVVVYLCNEKEKAKAKEYIKIKSSYFDDVYSEWKKYKSQTNMESYYRDEKANIVDDKLKPYFKETVVKNLMSIVNSKQ